MISPNRVRLKTPEWLDRKRGDLVMVDYLHETGIIMGEPYVGDDGHAYVSILLTDTPAQRCESRLAPLDLPGMICKQLVQRTHLLSRPTGSVPHVLLFRTSFSRTRAPKTQKILPKVFRSFCP